MVARAQRAFYVSEGGEDAVRLGEGFCQVHCENKWNRHGNAETAFFAILYCFQYDL